MYPMELVFELSTCLSSRVFARLSGSVHEFLCLFFLLKLLRMKLVGEILSVRTRILTTESMEPRLCIEAMCLHTHKHSNEVLVQLMRGLPGGNHTWYSRTAGF